MGGLHTILIRRQGGPVWGHRRVPFRCFWWRTTVGDALLVEELVVDADIDIQLSWAPSMADAEVELTRLRPDCVLLDLNLPDANGIAALDRVTKCDPAIPIVVLTGLNDEHFGVSALARAPRTIS